MLRGVIGGKVGATGVEGSRVCLMYLSIFLKVFGALTGHILEALKASRIVFF